MKILILSDTHLTATFDEVKFSYLYSLFSKFDQIILNGDFWDGYETTFVKFIRSKWRDLFPLMVEKKTIYLYGNHDKKEWTKNPNLFSIQQFEQYLLPVGRKELRIEHGHKLSPSFDISYPKLSYLLSTFFSSKHFPFGRSLRGWENMRMKLFAKENLRENQILVCGHSHIVEHNRKERYINTGLIDFGVASYLSINDSKIKLVTETFG